MAEKTNAGVRLACVVYKNVREQETMPPCPSDTATGIQTEALPLAEDLKMSKSLL